MRVRCSVTCVTVHHDTPELRSSSARMEEVPPLRVPPCASLPSSPRFRFLFTNLLQGACGTRRSPEPDRAPRTFLCLALGSGNISTIMCLYLRHRGMTPPPASQRVAASHACFSGASLSLRSSDCLCSHSADHKRKSADYQFGLWREGKSTRRALSSIAVYRQPVGAADPVT